MRIKELKAENYRLFDKLNFSFGSSPCLIVVDNNEQGKSSIVKAILDCLYTKKNLCETGEKGRLQLSFTIGNDDFLIIVGNKKKRLLKNGEDITRDFYKKAGRSFEYLFGEGLFGLNEEEFLNTVLVLQHGLNTLNISDKALSTKIQSMIELSSEDHSSAQAIRLLRDGLSKNFPRITVKTTSKGDVEQEIKNLTNHINSLRTEYESLLNRIATTEETVKEFEKTEEEIKETEKLIEKMRHLRIVSILYHDDKKRQRLETLKKEIESLQPYPELSEEEAENLWKKINSSYISFKEMHNSAEKTRQKIREREEELEKLTSLLNTYGIAKDRTIEDATLLYSIYQETVKLDREIHSLKETIERERSAFRFPFEEFSRMETVFSKLSDSEKHILHRYRLEKAEIEESINRLERIKTLRLNKRYSLLATVLSLVISISGYFLHPLLYMVSIISIVSLLFYLKNKKTLELIDRDILRDKNTIKEIEATIEDLKRRSLFLDETLKALQERIGYTIDDYQRFTEWSNEYHEIKAKEENLNSKINQRKRLLDNASKIINHEADIPDIKAFADKIKEASMLKERISSIKDGISILKDQLRHDEEEYLGREREIKEQAEYIFNMITQRDAREMNWQGFSTQELSEYLLSMLSRTQGAQKRIKEMEDIRVLSEEERASLCNNIKIKEGTLYKEEDLKEPSYYENQLTGLQEKAKNLHEYQSRLLMKRADIIQLKRRLFEIEDELEYLITHKKRAEAYRSSVMKAIDIIEELSRDRYKIWAERLNQETTNIFKSITGKDREIIFEKNLNFRINSDGRELTSQELKAFLSGGAIEQLFLSIRVTIAKHVCPHIRLPLILDEPFAHADDSRFLNAMRFLIEVVSKERQVIIFSCHKRRHRLIKENIIDGYELREGILQ